MLDQLGGKDREWRFHQIANVAFCASFAFGSSLCAADNELRPAAPIVPPPVFPGRNCAGLVVADHEDLVANQLRGVGLIVAILETGNPVRFQKPGVVHQIIVDFFCRPPFDDFEILTVAVDFEPCANRRELRIGGNLVADRASGGACSDDRTALANGLAGSTGFAAIRRETPANSGRRITGTIPRFVTGSKSSAGRTVPTPLARSQYAQSCRPSATSGAADKKPTTSVPTRSARRIDDLSSRLEEMRRPVTCESNSTNGSGELDQNPGSRWAGLQ